MPPSEFLLTYYSCIPPI